MKAPIQTEHMSREADPSVFPRPYGSTRHEVWLAKAVAGDCRESRAWYKCAQSSKKGPRNCLFTFICETGYGTG